MNFLDARMQRFNQMNRIPQTIPQTTPQTTPQIINTKINETIKEKVDAPKYNVADNRDEIIVDIIRQKPKIADLRKALKKYNKLAIEEHYEDIIN